MRRDFTLQRRAILGALVIVLLADAALAAYSWKMAAAPRTPQQEYARQLKQLDLLRADIKRAQEIKQNVPAIEKDWDRFEQSFPPASVGYSTMSSELGAVAKKAGVQIESVGFKPKDIPTRGLTEISIDASVSGEYAGVVRFVNGLQRSDRLYALDSLALASQAPGQGSSNAIKVSMRLKTYFRTAG
jgi:type IV pilus assembly protein PilO